MPLGHPGRSLSVENDIYEYGFNWPYDYFSLVELVKLDAELGFIKNEDSANPPEPEDVLDVIRRANLQSDEGSDKEAVVPFAMIVPKEDE